MGNIKNFLKSNIVYLLLLLFMLIVIVLQLVIIKKVNSIRVNIPITNNTYIIDSTRREIFQQYKSSTDSTYNTSFEELAKQIEQWNKSRK